MQRQQRQQQQQQQRGARCVQCVASKRKCDGTQPVCVRCASKNIICEYLPDPILNNAGDQNFGPDCEEAAKVDDSLRQSSSLAPAQQMEALGQFLQSSTYKALVGSFGREPSLADLGKGAGDLGRAPKYYTDDDTETSPNSSSVSDQTSSHSFSTHGSVHADDAAEAKCLNDQTRFDTMDLSDNLSLARAEVQLKMYCPDVVIPYDYGCHYFRGYIELPASKTCPGVFLERFAQYPRIFIQDETLPFVHPRLYDNGLPAPLLKAYSICTTIASLNRRNRVAVMQTTRSLVDELVAEHKRGQVTIRDKLALAQAFIVAQMARMFFSSDIGLESDGEKDSLLMLQMLDVLAGFLDHHPRTPSGEPKPQSFEDWVFLASLTRTLLFGGALQAYYMAERYHRVYSFQAMGFFQFSLSKRLWRSLTPDVWAQCYHQDHYMIVQFDTIQKAVEYPYDLDLLDYDVLFVVGLIMGGPVVEQRYRFDFTEHPEFVKWESVTL